ncbi:MAG: hypothetical protein LBC49_03940, partial [Bacteroidales bacterium]|nr:hypothetical protein [Bacteroidales bacterium]
MRKIIIVSFMSVVYAALGAFAPAFGQSVSGQQQSAPLSTEQQQPASSSGQQSAPSSAKQPTSSFGETVLVVAPYNPTLMYKPSMLVFTPQIRDTSVVAVTPYSDYVIYSTPEKTEYSIENVKPAKISGEPIDKLFHQHIKIGFGNYLTPLAEAYFSMGRDKNYGIAVSYKHLSSYGKIKDYSRYKSNFANHELDLLGQIFSHPDFTVTLGAYYNYHQVNCY